MAYLKADNGKFFTVAELLFKLQNLMANKELGDHVFFEGIEYEDHECKGNGLIDSVEADALNIDSKDEGYECN